MPLAQAAGIGPKSMLNDVYNRRILELAGTIPRIGRLEAPDASATAHSKLCGSTVTVDLLQAPRLAGRGLVKIYRYTLSPLVGFHCRHLPTCSEYADEALDRYGLWAGSWMTLARLLRCHPWGTSGIDRIPQTTPEGAR